MKWLALPFRILAACWAGGAMFCGLACMACDGVADALNSRETTR